MDFRTILPVASNAAAPNGDIMSELKAPNGQLLFQLNWSEIIRLGAEKYLGIKTPPALKSVP